MAKKRVKGNAANAKINGEWGAHVRPWFKKHTSGKRRRLDKQVINVSLKEMGLENQDNT